MAATILVISLAVIMAILGYFGLMSNFTGLTINELLEGWRNQEERNE